MPTYILRYSNLKFTKKQKLKIAKGITNTHKEVTGANTYFAQVIFHQNSKNSHYMGGKVVNSKEIFLNGQIRGGRSKKVKKNLIYKLRLNLIKEINVKKDNLWIYLEDLPTNQTIEYGEILPKSGKERSWFNSLPRNLKKRLSKIERNNEN